MEETKDINEGAAEAQTAQEEATHEKKKKTKRTELDELKAEIEEQLPTDLPHVFISSFTQEGIKELKDLLWNALQTENAPEEEVTVLFPGDDNEKPLV